MSELICVTGTQLTICWSYQKPLVYMKHTLAFRCLSIIVSLLIFVLNCCCTFYLLVVFGAKEAQFIIPLLSYFIVDVNEM